MSGPKAPIQQGAQFTRGYFGELGQIAERAAEEDEAGRWGIDGWIRMIHNLIDLQVRTAAAVAQAAMAGPWWLQATDREPLVSEEFDVVPQSYPRYFTIVKPFERLGHRDIRIPNTAIKFVPAILPPGATTFQIDLTDNNFVGANYVGEVALRRADSSRGEQQRAEPFSVTVGL